MKDGGLSGNLVAATVCVKGASDKSVVAGSDLDLGLTEGSF